MKHRPLVLTLTLAGLAACQAMGCSGQPSGGSADSGATASGAQSPGVPAVVVKRDNPCSVLFPGEVAGILGTPITLREVVDEVTCHFDYDAPEPGGPPYFEMKVYFEGGKAALAATRMASRLLGSDSGFEKLPGIGDEAWLGPMASTLVFVKGDAGVELDLRLVPDGRDKGVRLATLVAGRLAAAGF
jgi:hypothetical protein